MAFEDHYKYTKQFEGGYANDPVDRGGETFRGISRKFWPVWRGWPLIDEAKSRGFKTAAAINSYFKTDVMMEQMVMDFYRVNFWVPVDRLQAPDRPTGKMFDAAVNVGIGQAIKFAQRIIGAKADGVIGPQSQGAAREYFSRYGEDQFLTAYCFSQEQYYHGIVASNSSQRKFLNGWLKRAAWIPPTEAET
jgi:lysozyme family protein